MKKSNEVVRVKAAMKRRCGARRDHVARKWGRSNSDGAVAVAGDDEDDDDGVVGGGGGGTTLSPSVHVAEVESAFDPPARGVTVDGDDNAPAD